LIWPLFLSNTDIEAVGKLAALDVAVTIDVKDLAAAKVVKLIVFYWMELWLLMF